MGSSLRLDVVPKLVDPTLVLAFEGWNDAGDAASIAAAYLSNALQSAPMAEIDPEDYYDFTVRRPELSFQFRFGELPGRCSLVVGIGAEPHLRWRSFCDEVVELVQRLECRRVILLGAFLADVLYSRPVRISGFGSDVSGLEALGISATGYEGRTGVVGVLGQRLIDEGLSVSSFWAGLPHYVSQTPNPRGALALVQVTARALDLPVDREPLEAEAAEFEARISKMISADPALSEYVRELKKREFAQ
jgi:predicted ATP-grasp superfamily ATP-dependent carboligase